jgi:FAD/FMN-containing dehydrogenase
MTISVNQSEIQFDALADQISGAVVLAGDPDWDTVRRPWNRANDQRPDAVVVPADAQDISTVVLFAQDNGLRVVPQATGHLAAPLGDVAGSILLNTSSIKGIDIDVDDQVVRVGAGVVWGEVASALEGTGLTALAGSSHDVGVVGYTLGGGYSWLAREYGLASSSVTAIEVVTADGELRHVTAHANSELFWALRGGGGNAAIVTAITFQVFAIAEVYAGMLMYPISRAPEIFTAYERWTRELSDQATTCVRLLRLPPMPELPDFLRGQSFVVVDGAINASDAEADALLTTLRDLNPAIDTFTRVPTGQLTLMHLDPPAPVPAVGDGMILDELTATAIDTIMELAGPGVDTSLLLVDLRHLGGAVGHRDPRGGAIDHLPGRFLLYAVGIAPDPETAGLVELEVRRLIDSLTRWAGERDYSNFREAAVGPKRFYSTGVLARLRAVKRAYDPANVIRTSHELI